jgi:hypothetical protein
MVVDSILLFAYVCIHGYLQKNMWHTSHGCVSGVAKVRRGTSWRTIVAASASPHCRSLL